MTKSLVAVVLGVLFLIAASGLFNEARSQNRIRIAVTAFENKVKTPWGDPSWKIGEGLAEMLTTELIRTGRFIVVERLALGDVVREQELGQTGLISKGTAAQSGQILGAQYVVRGAVTEFEQRASGGGAGIGVPEFRFEGEVENAHVALDLRLIDTSTGQIMASHHASSVARSGGGAFGAQAGSVTFGGDVFFQTPIGRAARGAIRDALQFVLATRFQSGPRSFAIVKVEGSHAYINAGANMGVKVGDVFEAYSKGETLIDPETGLNLGSTEQVSGLIEITQVAERFSIGIIRRGGVALKRGDRVRDR